jgi:hypothetical protein
MTKSTANISKIVLDKRKKFDRIQKQEREKEMKTYYIYDSENDFYLGIVLAKDWVDARSVWASAHGVSFGAIFACATPL